MTGRAATADIALAVRPMSEADVPAVVRLHREAFADSFMTTFGEGFLSAFYAELIAHPDGYGCVVAGAGERPEGFCVGATGAGQGLARDMLRARPLSFVWPALFSVARSPRRLGRVLRLARSYLRPGPGGDIGPAGALLMQIAVAEHLRGTGAAEQLVERFLDEMRSRGVQSVTLGVEPDNARAIAFYRRIGFQEAKIGVFEFRLAPSQRSGP